MGFYATTENPNMMMRENHNTQSFEYIIIYQNGLYIVSTTPQEIFAYVKGQIQDQYLSTKINIHMILVEEILINIK